MSDLPDLRAHGYEALAPLGANAEGGRVTFRARAVAGGREVVVKQFRFATPGARWQEFDAHQREIQALRELRHPRIPALVEAFQTDDGFCLVQEYVPYPALSSRASFDLDELRAIAASVLEILEYLQGRVPPVFHRDLKPANILIDGGKAFLVDFGLARAGAGARSGSTIAVGTPGFMPPEQLFGRTLAPSSDLYGLGATLIGLLSGRPAGEVGDLVDNSFRFKLDELPPALPRVWRAWLAKLVAPEVEDRYADARAARAALPPPGAADDEPRAAPAPVRARAAAPPRAGEDEVARAVRAIRESADPQAALAETRAALARRKRVATFLFMLVPGAFVAAGLWFVGRSSDAPLDDSPPEATERAPLAPAVTAPAEAPMVEPPAPEVDPRGPAAPSPGETEEAKHDRWARDACEGVLDCYTAAGYRGVLTMRAEADLAPDGHATAGRFRGDGGGKIKSCVVDAMRAKHAPPDYDGGKGTIWCEISGQLMGGGTMMIGSGEGWTPAPASSRPPAKHR
jgi:serine/threonine protein kinase